MTAISTTCIWNNNNNQNSESKCTIMNHHVSKRNENIGKLSKKKGINSKSKNRIDQIKITRV